VTLTVREPAEGGVGHAGVCGDCGHVIANCVTEPSHSGERSGEIRPDQCTRPHISLFWRHPWPEKKVESVMPHGLMTS